MSTATISFSAETCAGLFAARKYDELSEHLLRVLDQIETLMLHEMDDRKRYFLDVFLDTLFFFFTQPGYFPSQPHAARFLRHNQTISSLAALSSFGNTDFALRLLLQQQNNFFKILALYSPRNRLRIDRKQLFDTDPDWASQWWFAFVGEDFGRLADRETLQHLREHFRALDPRMKGTYFNMHHAYFLVTYADQESERQVKAKINEMVQSGWAASIQIDNRPAANQAAVVTGFWFPQHSVYRTNHRYVEALASTYELTLIDISPPGLTLDTAIFKRVIRIEPQRGGFDLTALLTNDFSLVYYPDIGMTPLSLLLSNLRLAPVQMMSLGHPVSTFGSQIDYFIGGQASELLEEAERNYSERLVLVPGIGLQARRLDHPRGRPAKQASPILVNCPWFGHKTNYEMLELLRRIRLAVRSPVLFQIFPSTAIRNAGLLPFAAAVTEMVGLEHTRIHPPLTQPDYFDAIEQGHLSVDALPFGGFNTLIDSLYLGVPFLAFEGRRCYNRFAAAFYRGIGLEELIATSGDEFVAKTARLIDDADYRQDLTRRVEAIDLEEAAFSYDPTPAFRRAVDYLAANDAVLKAYPSRAPLIFD
jgi:hypothetical protein